MLRPSRRELLASVATAAGVAAGCLSEPDGSGSPTVDATRRSATTTAPTTAPDATTDGSRSDPIEVDLRNGLDRAIRVRVTVAGAAGRVSEQVAEVPADGRTALGSGIDQVGEYTVAVDTSDGPAGEATVGIGDYDIANGSNIIVSIHTGDVQFLIQE